MTTAIRAALTCALIVSGASTTVSAQTEPACTRPDSPPRVLGAVAPETPLGAMQLGITGKVEMRIELDDQSKIVGKPVAISGPFELRAVSIASARNSTFQTQIVNCVPVKSTYRYVVQFSRS